MKSILIKILLIVSLFQLNVRLIFSQTILHKYTSYVNPLIGTGALKGSLSGNNYPGATVPFGMVQLSPDTRDAPDWSIACGYDYNDSTIAGFSHTHLSGTGVPELFDVLFMPTTGAFNMRAGNAVHPGIGYASRFKHSDERARPGYYQVRLTDYDINAELTATAHAGFHRYKFPSQSQAHVVIDLNHSLKKPDWGCHVISSQFKLVNSYTVEGYRLITGWAKMRKIYFHLEFSSPITGNLMADGDAHYLNQQIVNGTDLRAVFNFKLNGKTPLLAKIGFSAVSINNAKQNLAEEIPHWDFDKTVQEADKQWEKQLSKIQVEGDEIKKEIFYTGMYHAFLQPNNLADVNGDYMATDFTIQKAKDGTHYSTFSLWDTYRAAHPLYTLIQPELNVKFINSMLRQYRTYGHLPVWQLWGQETYCMIGNHAIPVIVDAIFKDLPGIDVNEAYQAIKQSCVLDHPNAMFSLWDKYHYIPEDMQSQSVSLTLEISFDDWCVAQLAKKLGKKADYEYFTQRALYYKNLYDASTGFFRGKDSKGTWIVPFNPLQYGSNGGYPFTEGNAWQYLWYVPQNIPDLIALTGGDKAFADKLDSFFTLKANTGEVNNNASGFIGQYAHGNEPSHHITYLYDYIGQPWKTQFYTSKIVDELYNNLSSGYAGNEDCGQMSSWYIFSAMGFYPVNPSSGVFAIGSPAFKSATIRLAQGKSFIIKASLVSKANIYIQSAFLNGKPYSNASINYRDIIHGGVLEFVMGPVPNRQWGNGMNDRPGDNGY